MTAPSPHEVSDMAKDALYVTVGLGFLTFQKAQVRRQELQRRFQGRLDDRVKTIAERLESFAHPQRRLTRSTSRRGLSPLGRRACTGAPDRSPLDRGPRSSRQPPSQPRVSRRAGRVRCHFPARRPHRCRHVRGRDPRSDRAGGRFRLVGYSVSWRGRGDVEAALPSDVRVARRPMAARPLRELWPRAEWPPIEWWTGPVDVVHGPNFVVPPTGRGAAELVTVHDLTCVHHPELCTPDTLEYPHLIRRALRRGAHVHAVSRFVADEVDRCLRCRSRPGSCGPERCHRAIR